jgi:hypothetical protein
VRRLINSLLSVRPRDAAVVCELWYSASLIGKVVERHLEQHIRYLTLKIKTYIQCIRKMIKSLII